MFNLAQSEAKPEYNVLANKCRSTLTADTKIMMNRMFKMTVVYAQIQIGPVSSSAHVQHTSDESNHTVHTQWPGHLANALRRT